MGREVRKVAADWEHPKDNGPNDYKPLYDESFEDAVREWKDGYARWEAGTHEDLQYQSGTDTQYWEWVSTPDREMCRPHWTEEQRTHFQLYETVTEGTPLSPPMPSLEDLAVWLANHNDYWAQKRGSQNRSYAAWLAFLKEGWAPSMISTPEHGVEEGVDAVIRMAGEPL